MECAAAEQSVPLVAASPSAQHLLEQRMGLPKGAVANSGSCGGRGWTDGQPPALPAPGCARGPGNALLLQTRCKGCFAGHVTEQRVHPLPAHTPAGPQPVKGARGVCSAGWQCLLLPKQSVIQTPA